MPSTPMDPSAPGLRFPWDGQPLDETRFHARACLLSVRGIQQDLGSLMGTSEGKHDRLDDDESDDDGSDTDTVAPRKLARIFGIAKLKESFLDRLAEVLSREKPLRGEKANHVAATAMIERDDRATIYVSKNGGLDDVDKSMLQVLQIWVRAVAADGRRRDTTKDAMWKKLVEYYQKRLGYYRQRLTQGLQPYSATIDTVYTTKTWFSGLAKLCSRIEPVGSEWHEIVSAAYELQYDKTVKSDLAEIANFAFPKLWQSIMLLGRLRVAYETFIECALHLAIFKKVEIIANDSYVKVELAERLSHRLPPALADPFHSLTSRQRKAFNMKFAEPCIVHAEVQLLMQLEHILMEESNAMNVFDYIGCSKKTCYLCCKLIVGHRFYHTRGTHGKIYPQWTVPASNDVSTASRFRIKVALVDTECDMITRFETSFGSRHLPLVAESSVGIPVHSETSMNMHRLRQLGLDAASFRAPESAERGKDPPVNKLGKRRTSFQALRIPADSRTPIGIVRLFTYETEEGYSCVDETMRHVPDFARFWGENCNFDRAMDKFSATNQEPKSLNGDYRVHWNLNDDLPENETLKGILGLTDVPSHRRFWYGDVFIERIGERNGYDFDEQAYHLYDNIPQDILESRLIGLIFRDCWDREILEQSLKEDTEHQDIDQRWERDRELVLQRMTPIEREVLKLMPPGTLDMIAMTECDVNAVERSEMAMDPDNPGFVQIRTFYKESTKIEKDMEWFSSSQL